MCVVVEQPIRDEGLDRGLKPTPIDALHPLSPAQRAELNHLREALIQRMNAWDTRVQFSVEAGNYQAELPTDVTEFHLEVLDPAIRASVSSILKGLISYLDLPEISDNLDQLSPAVAEDLIQRIKREMMALDSALDAETFDDEYYGRHGIRRGIRNLTAAHQEARLGEGNLAIGPYDNKKRGNQFSRVVSAAPMLPVFYLTEPMMNQYHSPAVHDNYKALKAATSHLPDVYSYNDATPEGKAVVVGGLVECATETLVAMRNLLQAIAEEKAQS